MLKKPDGRGLGGWVVGCVRAASFTALVHVCVGVWLVSSVMHN